MCYEDLVRHRRVRSASFGREEIEGLMRGATAKLKASALEDMDPEIRHNLVYDAIRSAAQAVMASEGYRPAGAAAHHQAVFDFLALADGGRWATEARCFQRSRRKRNRSEYEEFGLVSPTEANELVATGASFIAEVRDWLQSKGILPEE